MTITEVLNFLRSTSPKLNYSRGQLNFGATNASSSAGGGTGKLSKEKGVVGWQNEKVVSQVLSDAFLANGHSLAVAFLGEIVVVLLFQLFFIVMTNKMMLNYVLVRMFGEQWRSTG